MEISIHKFGGASVKNAEAVKNIATILDSFPEGEKAVIVVSAMGKTTNKLEKVWSEENEVKAGLELEKIAATHISVANKLELNEKFIDSMWELFKLPEMRLPENKRYDSTVALGELASTKILAEYLSSLGWNCGWWDARQTIKTNEKHRSARVNENDMWSEGKSLRDALESHQFIVTQGFIGQTPSGATTTLGREGSDYSAALLARATDALKVTIWKDVQGMHNADPRIFNDTVTIESLDYSEALELSYYGASVIHPRTVKPLQNKNIPLYVKSFINPDGPSTCIGKFETHTPQVPLYISRKEVTLVSLGPADHSFVGEDHLETVFAALSAAGIHVRMMQNSAVRFDLVFDSDEKKQANFESELEGGFWIESRENLELLTIRHGEKELIDSLTADRKVLIEQVNPTTTRRLVEA